MPEEKGQWTRQFHKNNTANAPFSVTAQRKVQALLMNLTAECKYAEVEGLQLLELPYVGDDLSMVVLLPRAIDGLTGMEGLLNEQTLDTWLAHARNQKVNVFLPKFKLTAQFSLAQTLAGMGMSAAFSPSADFSGMDGARDLCISAVVHKAFVDVNEEGTEAAAATGTVMKSMALMRLYGVEIRLNPLVRIPMKADTCSNPYRTPFRACRTVVGAKRRSEGVINGCSTGVKVLPLVSC
jgi:serpin B